MTISVLFLLVVPAQAPVEVAPAAPMAAEPLAAEVAPTVAEVEAAGMPESPPAVAPAPVPPPQPARRPGPAPAHEVRARGVYGSPPDPYAPPHGQIRAPPPPRVHFKGLTPYIEGRVASYSAFYAEIGRYDLVEDYSSGKRLKNGLLIGGAAGFGAAVAGWWIGYFLWADDLIRLSLDNERLTLFTERGGTVMLVSIGVGLVSVAVALIGYLTDPQPLSPAQARALYDRWAQTGDAKPISWQLTPVATDGGGGLALSAEF